VVNSWNLGLNIITELKPDEVRGVVIDNVLSAIRFQRYEWTSNYLGSNPKQARFPEWPLQYLFCFTNMPWINPAPVLRTDAPDLLVLSVSIADQIRHIHLRITNSPAMTL